MSQGRLIDHLRNSQSVGLEDLQLLVMDEADRLLEMGFSEEVLAPLPTPHDTIHPCKVPLPPFATSTSVAHSSSRSKQPCKPETTCALACNVSLDFSGSLCHLNNC